MYVCMYVCMYVYKVPSDLHEQLSVRLWQYSSRMITNTEDARSFDLDDYYYSIL